MKDYLEQHIGDKVADTRVKIKEDVTCRYADDVI